MAEEEGGPANGRSPAAWDGRSAASRQATAEALTVGAVPCCVVPCLWCCAAQQGELPMASAKSKAATKLGAPLLGMGRARLPPRPRHLRQGLLRALPRRWRPRGREGARQAAARRHRHGHARAPRGVRDAPPPPPQRALPVRCARPRTRRRWSMSPLRIAGSWPRPLARVAVLALVASWASWERRRGCPDMEHAGRAKHGRRRSTMVAAEHCQPFARSCQEWLHLLGFTCST
jgi:hypothetical protein